MLKVIGKSSNFIGYDAVITLPTTTEQLNKVMEQLGGYRDFQIKDLEVENLCEGLLKFEKELMDIKDIYTLNDVIKTLNSMNKKNYIAVMHYVKNLGFNLYDAIVKNEGYPAIEVHEKSLTELAFHYVNSVWCYDDRVKRFMDINLVVHELKKYERFGEVDVNGKKYSVRTINV